MVLPNSLFILAIVYARLTLAETSCPTFKKAVYNDFFNETYCVLILDIAEVSYPYPDKHQSICYKSLTC